MTTFCRDLLQTLGCMNDLRSNPQLKRRRDLDIIDSPTSQGEMGERVSSAGSLQRQISGAKSDPPVPAPVQPSNTWGIDNCFTPQMNRRSHVQPIMTSHDNTLNHPIPQNTDSALFLARTNSHPFLYAQGAHAPHLLVSLRNSTDDPSSMSPNYSEDLFAMWSNLPLTSRCVLVSSIMTFSDIPSV